MWGGAHSNAPKLMAYRFGKWGIQAAHLKILRDRSIANIANYWICFIGCRYI